MYVLHINSDKDIGKIDKMINEGKHVFILVYMEGCGPCNATRPEWDKLGSALKGQYSSKKDLAIIDVNKDFASKIKHIGTIDGFPTMKYISQHGKNVELYEDSHVSKKDRSVDSFIDWIERNVNKYVSTTPHDVYKRLNKTHKKGHHKRHNKHSKKHHKHNKGMRGGKWSLKYKRSINCKRPRGFSQRQYCLNKK